MVEALGMNLQCNVSRVRSEHQRPAVMTTDNRGHAAGHSEQIRWNTQLNPDPKNLDALYAILDDRERPYYEHRMAA